MPRQREIALVQLAGVVELAAVSGSVAQVAPQVTTAQRGGFRSGRIAAPTPNRLGNTALHVSHGLPILGLIGADKISILTDTTMARMLRLGRAKCAAERSKQIDLRAYR